ncbi:Transportin-3 [Hondaea fermentalgiana]|uniref:Transportin-3 n=1 Tax=Hondaea fermentalgiana TaxID=2315210 RepID=A0A2R5G9Q7_9STRA|nr:Transportin-3 [Hondaea fermentalgiana]|eukprot:GBG27049.1 Transportin-3 [Hondaea fermentalgiana]
MSTLEELGARFASACEAVLDGKNPERQREANKWMMEFQKQAEAWSVVDKVLEQPNERVSVEMQFLAAKTFHTKIRYDFMEQVPASARPELREKLLQHLERHFGDRKRKQVVTTQLSLAVAALAVQMREWESPIKDLASRFGSGGASESALCLIEILQIIPEDMTSPLFAISEERRSQLSMEMFDCSADVLRFLTVCAESSGADAFVQMKILNCLREWIKCVEFDGFVFAESPLLAQVFTIVEECSELVDSAVDVIIETVHTYSRLERPEHKVVMGVVAPKVFALMQLYARAASEDDDEICTGLAKIFAHTARSYVRQLLRHTDPGTSDDELTRILQLALAGPQHTSSEVAMVTWHAWLKILEEMWHPPPLSRQEHGKSIFAERRAFLTPFLEDLLRCGFRHLRVPDDLNDAQQVCLADLDEEVANYRSDIESIVEKVSSQLSAASVLTLLKPQLEAAAQALVGMQQRQMPIGHASAWSQVEALLDATIPIAPTVSRANSDSTPSVAIDFIIQVCLRLPDASMLLRETICCVFGEYADFLHFNPQKLEPVIKYELDTIVAAPKLGLVVCRAMEKLAVACRGELLVAVPRIFEVAISPNSGLSDEDRVNLLVTIALAVQFRSYDECLEAVRHVTRHAVDTLQQAARTLEAGQDVGAQMPAIVFSIRTIDMFIRYGWVPPRTAQNEQQNNNSWQSTPAPPSLVVFQEVWPALCVVAEGLCTTPAVENLAALFKVALRSFKSHFKPYFAPLMNLMVSCFRKSKMSPFLYATGIAIEIFGEEEPAHAQDYAAVLGALSEIVFEVLSGPDAMEGHPDLVEDYFNAIDRGLRVMPIEVIQAPFFPAAFHCSAAGAALSHRRAGESLLYFIESVLETGIQRDGQMAVYDQTIPVIRQCFSDNGQLLVNNVVAGIAGGLSASRIGSSSGGSLSMMLFTVSRFLRNLPGADPCAFSNSVRHALRANCPHVSNDLADDFVRKICDIKNNPSTFRDAIYDFSQAARLRLRRTVDN